jgi:hypothetical protein
VVVRRRPKLEGEAAEGEARSLLAAAGPGEEEAERWKRGVVEAAARWMRVMVERGVRERMVMGAAAAEQQRDS